MAARHISSRTLYGCRLASSAPPPRDLDGDMPRLTTSWRSLACLHGTAKPDQDAVAIRMLAERGTEYCGKPARHDYPFCPALNDIEPALSHSAGDRFSLDHISSVFYIVHLISAVASL